MVEITGQVYGHQLHFSNNVNFSIGYFSSFTPLDPYIGRYWHRSSKGRIVCKLCPRFCKLNEGQRGFCYVRKNIDGQLILTTYNRSSGFCIDPIEKKPLNHFFPGTSVLSFGTAGCNLGCKFCQNWDITKSREWDRLTDWATPESIAETAKRYGCESVAFTYNDPIIFVEYAMDIADACHEIGIKTVAVTAGYINDEARYDFFSKMDAANIDLKSFSEGFYRHLTLSQMAPVLQTLEYVKKETNVWLEITNLLIPGENDSKEEIDNLTCWIAENLGVDVPLHFTAFHPDYKMITHQRTPQSTLQRARDIGLANGLSHVYVGNIFDPNGSSTYCTGCSKMLIKRTSYELGQYHIVDGQCVSCGTICEGHFANAPGNWGNRRKPVRILDNALK